MTSLPDDFSPEDDLMPSDNGSSAAPNEPHDADGETANPDLAGGELAEVISVEPADVPAVAEATAAAAVDDVPAAVEVVDEETLLAEEAGEADEFEAVVESPYDRPGQWFVVHTYAGYENKVKSNLESRIASMNMEERI